MRKLILGTGMGFSDISIPEQIVRIKKAGWDGVFTGWDEENGNRGFRDVIDREGLIYHSIHAPFDNIHTLWEEGENGERQTERQIRCLRDCADANVQLVIMHAIIGMERCTPNELGIERFGRIFEEARKLGITVALENTEGEVYLEALLNAYSDCLNVGFCIDTGHEMCYNYSRDLITKYGSRLVSTHLNDNMKITGEKLTWRDDSHLLPFDGLADWDGIAERLNKVGYKGPLTFELRYTNKPERHTNDIYAHLNFDSFVALALERARRFDGMLN